jgi:hypothetical protein
METPLVVAMKGRSLGFRVRWRIVVLNIDKNRVTGGLFRGHNRGGGGGSVDSASSGSRSKASDGLVDIDIDIGFVNNFPD